MYDSVSKTDHALVKDTYVDQATQVVQATTSDSPQLLASGLPQMRTTLDSICTKYMCASRTIASKSAAGVDLTCSLSP